MADINLRKMSRKELLDLLAQQMNENEYMKARLIAMEAEINAAREESKKQFADRRNGIPDAGIPASGIPKAGTMAEAVMRLNMICEDTDLAVQQYHENIKKYNEKAEAMTQSIKDEASREADMILAAAKSEAENTCADARISAQTALSEAKKEAEAIISDAQRQASSIRLELDQYQKDVKTKTAQLYFVCKKMQSILGSLGNKKI